MPFRGYRGEVTLIPQGEEWDVEWKMSFASLSEEEDAVYCSPGFSFEGETWWFSIRPNGAKSMNSKGYIHLQLINCSSSGHPMNVEICFSLKSVNGDKDFRRRSTGMFNKVSEVYNYHDIARFLSRDHLEKMKSEFLSSDGFLTVVCTMKRLKATGSASGTVKAVCSHCEKTFDAGEILLHEKKCRIKCPDCSSIVLYENWHDHECQISNIEANSQLKEQLLAVSQELEIEKNVRKQLESQILTLEKEICELQSASQDNSGLNSEAETKENEGVVEISSAEINIDIAGKSRIAESCDSKDGNNVTERKESVSPENYDIVDKVNCFLKEKEGIDVTFELDDGSEVFAHKLILAIRSSFFADEFYSKERNQEHKTIPLKGVDPKAFEKMIRYCYDCEPGLKTTEEACAMLQVAFEFRVMSLVKVSGAFLKQKTIEPKNVFKVLDVSEKTGDRSLKDRCLKVLEEKTESVLASCELGDVTPSVVHRILKLPKLSLHSEYELILWVLDWAKLKSEDEDSNCKGIRDYLENLLPDMNFLSLTCEQFAQFCKDHPDFFTLEEVASLSLNIMTPGTRKMPEWYNKDLKRRVYTGSKE